MTDVGETEGRGVSMRGVGLGTDPSLSLRMTMREEDRKDGVYL